VVKKGFLFTKDKVVPLDFVENAHVDRVMLKGGPGDLDDFPDFEETHYIQTEYKSTSASRDLGGKKPLAWYYPMAG
jgi:hypothetical protein